jgi:hypothetical protein
VGTTDEWGRAAERGGGASSREKVGRGGPRVEGESADVRERGAWAGIGPAEEGEGDFLFLFIFSFLFL